MFEYIYINKNKKNNMKKIIILILITLYGCSSTKHTVYKEISVYEEISSFKDDINKSIIDGFYNNDTTNVVDIYLLK